MVGKNHPYMNIATLSFPDLLCFHIPIRCSRTAGRKNFNAKYKQEIVGDRQPATLPDHFLRLGKKWSYRS